MILFKSMLPKLLFQLSILLFLANIALVSLANTVETPAIVAPLIEDATKIIIPSVKAILTLRQKYGEFGLLCTKVLAFTFLLIFIAIMVSALVAAIKNTYPLPFTPGP